MTEILSTVNNARTLYRLIKIFELGEQEVTRTEAFFDCQFQNFEQWLRSKGIYLVHENQNSNDIEGK